MFPERSSRSFLDPAVLARLAGFPLLPRRPMQGNVSGRHPSPHRGSSVEFAEYRKYVPGDDLRRLDWRKFGRSDRFFVKEFEADTNPLLPGCRYQRVDGIWQQRRLVSASNSLTKNRSDRPKRASRAVSDRRRAPSLRYSANSTLNRDAHRVHGPPHERRPSHRAGTAAIQLTRATFQLLVSCSVL